MTDTADKLRAVFLAAIMALSLVAMTATFAGAAAAQNVDPEDTGVTSIDIEESEDQRTLIDEDPDGDVLRDGADSLVGDITQTVNVSFAVNDTADDDEAFTSGDSIFVDVQDSLESGVNVSNVDVDDASVTVDDVDFVGFDVEDDSQVAEFNITADGINSADESFEFDVDLEAGDVDADDFDTIEDDIEDLVSATPVHVAFETEVGTSDTQNYRTVAAGTAAGSFDSTEDIDDILDLDPDDTEYTQVFEGEVVTFEAEEDRDEVRIFELEEDDDGNASLGDQVERTGTTPGQAVNIGTDGLEGDHLVQYGDDDENLTFLEVEPLGLEAEFSDNETNVGDDVTVDVSSEDLSGTEVEATFFEDEVAPGNQVGDTPSDELDSDGEASLPVDTNDLGEGTFIAEVEHDESEVTATTGELEIGEAPDDAAEIVSPDGDEFPRGDVVPIEFEFEETDEVYFTFGDEDEQNLEVNMTVEDTDGSGDATVLLNTFQLGNDSDRNLGFHGAEGTEVSVDEDTAFVNEDLGGSNTGAVAAGITYDLRITLDTDNPVVAGGQLEDLNRVNLVERGTEDLTAWTAPNPDDDNAPEFEFTDDVADAIDEGSLTPIPDADGSLADGDQLVLSAESTGLEGAIHEAVMLAQNDSVGAFDDEDVDALEAASFILDREDDHFITDEFDVTNLVIEEVQNISDGPDLLNVETEVLDDLDDVNIPDEEADIDVDPDSVLAGTDDDGNLDEYFIVYDVGIAEDAPVDIEDEPEVESTFTVESPANETLLDDAFVSNLAFVETDEDGDSLENATATYNLVPDEAEIEMTGDELNVPVSDEVVIEGTTTLAPGSQLDIRLTSQSGQADSFFIEDTVTVDDDGTFSITEDFSEFTAGTQFTVAVDRDATGDTLTEAEAVISEAPAVEEFVFEDQDSGGSTVLVDTFNTTQGGLIAVLDADDEILGVSDELDAGLNERVAITLDEDIEEDQELTVRAHRTLETFYVDDDGDAITRTAEVIVEDEEPPEPDEDPAEFRVSDLDPQTAELEEPGPVVDVSATISNAGDEEGTQTVELTLDGETLASEEVTLDGDESTTVTFEADTGELEFGETYTHAIVTEDDEAAGALIIEEEEDDEPEDTPEDTPDDDADDDGAGFGVVVALLAFLGAALLAVRRQTRE